VTRSEEAIDMQKNIAARLIAPALCAAALLFTTVLRAQDYPTKPVRIIIPVPPGAAVERMARFAADQVQKLGQPVIVESRAGAGGNIGAEQFARSAPDGHTLMVTAASVLVINKSLYPKLNYDPDTFVPVSLLATSPNVLMVHPSVPATTLQQFIAYAKANPGKLNFGSGGSGSTAHLTAELFTALGGVDIVHVPYKGSAPAITDLLGGQVSMVFLEQGSALPHVRTAKLRALGVGSEKRSALLPDVPAIAEAVPGFNSQVWFGMVAPAGTPVAIANRLSALVGEGMRQPEMVKRLLQLGVDARGSTPAEFAAFMKEETARWGKVIRSAGVTAE
jgi:tripartite-type tricarboxylate transporter receptor subunit TctC